MSTGFLNQRKTDAGGSVSSTKSSSPPRYKLPPMPKVPPRPNGPPSTELKPPMASPPVCAPPPAEDCTQAYSSSELQVLVNQSIPDAPASEDFTRQYAEEEWNQLRKRACASDPPKSREAADIARVVKANDTIPDSDELTRVYVRVPAIENSQSPNTAPGAHTTSAAGLALGLRNFASNHPGEPDNSTQVATRYRARSRRAWAIKAFRVFVYLGIIANMFLWGALLLNGRGKEKTPVWWKSCGAYAHHLYIEFLPKKPTKGR
jgi:hypothetical protein